MKPISFILLALLFTGCVKGGVEPVAAKTATPIATVATTKTTVLDAYDYNGTTGTAIIQVTCSQCTAIATIGDVSTPFIFNAQGVGQLKYTPVKGMSVYIAVCPDSVKNIKTDIFDTTNTSVYSFAGLSGNWNYTYIVK